MRIGQNIADPTGSVIIHQLTKIQLGSFTGFTIGGETPASVQLAMKRIGGKTFTVSWFLCVLGKLVI